MVSLFLSLSFSPPLPRQGDGKAGAGKGNKMEKKATSADGQRVQVLHELDGYVERGEMLAIIGAWVYGVMLRMCFVCVCVWVKGAVCGRGSIDRWASPSRSPPLRLSSPHPT